MADDSAEAAAAKQLLQNAKTLRWKMKTKERVVGGRRVDFFSGQRLVEHIEKHCSTAAPTREAALELAQRMLVAGFFVSAVWNERTVKLKSGGEKVKKELVPRPDLRQFRDGKEPYIWIMASHNPWSLFIGIGILLLIVGGVLMPLWPMWMRVGVSYIGYAALGLLGLLLLAELLHFLLYYLVYYGSGRRIRFILLPHLNDDVGFFESFKPFYSLEFDTPGDASKSSDASADVSAAEDGDDEGAGTEPATPAAEAAAAEGGANAGEESGSGAGESRPAAGAAVRRRKATTD